MILTFYTILNFLQISNAFKVTFFLDVHYIKLHKRAQHDTIYLVLQTTKFLQSFSVLLPCIRTVLHLKLEYHRFFFIPLCEKGAKRAHVFFFNLIFEVFNFGRSKNLKQAFFLPDFLVRYYLYILSISITDKSVNEGALIQGNKVILNV